MFGHPCIHSSKILYAAVSCSTNGDNTIVAATSGKKIRVLNYVLNNVGTSVTMTWQSGAGGTALSGAMQVGQTGHIEAQFSPVGHFETAKGALLNLSLSGGQAIAGHITYQLVDG